MKHITLAILTVLLLPACSTFKQAGKDFSSFKETILNCNQPADTWLKEGWSSNCNYCLPTFKCNTGKCPNKSL